MFCWDNAQSQVEALAKIVSSRMVNPPSLTLAHNLRNAITVDLSISDALTLLLQRQTVQVTRECIRTF